MIAGVKPYPAMKDSGVPWLGMVPEHWNVRRGKWLFRHRKEINSDRASTNVLSLTLRGVVNNDPEDPEGLVPKDYATYQRFNRGDLVFKLIDLENLRTSRVGLVHEDGIMSSAYVRLVPRSPGKTRYFFQQYFDLYQRGIYNQLGAGVRSTLGPADLLDLSVVVPPLPEQVAIVRFLDHADRRIRRYIRAKQKLIKLLEEQKQAIIHRAVTRGLDPKIRLKPSGVEWLADVPEHWDVRPAKWFFREVDERSASGDEELLSVSHLTGVTPRSQKIVTMFMAESYVGHKVCRPGDLVINTMWAWMAALGVARQVGLVSPAYGVYRPRRGSPLIDDYADLLLRTRPYVSEYICRSTGIQSSRLRLYPEQFLRIPVVCPPEAEQRAILANVESGTADMTKAIAAALREVQLFHEYRTRLIADVVTGKLDVREAAAQLPDEVEEPKPLDEAEVVDDAEESDAGNGDIVHEEVET
ncbi:MAG: restriction endonuclease subunit S [Burkholderiales bacterium]|nr:restriction endonuclease subunit S [Burkholderiales bacterium]